LIPTIREEWPDFSQPSFQIPFHIDIVLEYNRDIVVSVRNLTKDFEMRMPAGDLYGLQAGMKIVVTFINLCGTDTHGQSGFGCSLHITESCGRLSGTGGGGSGGNARGWEEGKIQSSDPEISSGSKKSLDVISSANANGNSSGFVSSCSWPFRASALTTRMCSKIWVITGESLVVALCHVKVISGNIETHRINYGRYEGIFFLPMALCSFLIST
jgi:hypothetical protein